MCTYFKVQKILSLKDLWSHGFWIKGYSTCVLGECFSLGDGRVCRSSQSFL